MIDIRKLMLSMSLAIAVVAGGCGTEAEQTSAGAGSSGGSAGESAGSSDSEGSESGNPGDLLGSEQDADIFEVHVTGEFFSGTQIYRVPVSAVYGNFFDSTTYLQTRAGEGPGEFLAMGEDSSGLYRLSLQFQGSEPGSYPFGNGNEISLYLRNNGTPDPRCGQTAGPCVGVALSMIDGAIEVETLEGTADGRRVRLSFRGSFERTDTPGEGRDVYEVEGRADFEL